MLAWLSQELLVQVQVNRGGVLRNLRLSMNVKSFKLNFHTVNIMFSHKEEFSFSY